MVPVLTKYHPLRMNNRSNKRRICMLFHGRFHGPFIWRSTEDMAWDNLAPVGREFGSPDYERLSILDGYSWGNITEQEAMRHLGVDRDGLAAMLKADGLELPEAVLQSRRETADGLSPRREVGDARALKGMFGKSEKAVSIEDMNPLHRNP